MKKIILVLFFTLSILKAQTEDIETKPSFGVNIGGSYLDATIDRNYLSNFNVSKFFNSYSGAQFSLGLSYEYPLNDFLRIGLNLNTSNSLFEIKSDVYGNMLNADGDSVSAKYKHELNYTFSKVSVSPFISIEPIEHFFLNLYFENNFLFDSKLIFNKIFDDKENYVFPENNSRDLTIYSGEVEGAKSYTGSIGFGVGYEIFLSKDKSLTLTPMANISFPINSELENYDWLTTRMGLNLKLSYFITPSKSYEVNYNEIFRTDTIIIRKPYPIEQFKSGKTFYTTEIDTVGTYINYTRIASRTDTLIKPIENPPDILIEADTMIVQKQIIEKYYPLLTSYYFTFNTGKLINPKNEEFSNMFNFTKHSIDTIANRLYRNSGAVVLIRAYKDKSEKAGCSITLDRSNFLKEILTQQFGVNENQVQIDTNLNDCILENVNSPKQFNSKAEIISIFSDVISPIYANEIIFNVNKPLTLDIYGENMDIYPVIDDSKINFFSTNSKLIINSIPKTTFETSDIIPLDITYSNKILPSKLYLRFDKQTVYKINFLTFDLGQTQLNPFILKQLEIICRQINTKAKVKITAISSKLVTEDILNKRIEYLTTHLRDYFSEIDFDKPEIIHFEKTDNPYLLDLSNTLLLEITLGK